MHYKNGREAKNGDKVMLIPSYGPPVIGVLYDATAGNDYCNGKIAPVLPSDPCPNLKECLHLDDALSAINGDLNCAVPVPPVAPVVADPEAPVTVDSPSVAVDPPAAS